MGTGFRVFLVRDDDSLKRIPMARYNRLIHGEPGENLPEFAEKRVRCIFVVLEIDGRIPLAVTHIDYFLLSFDESGRLDPRQWEKETRLVGEMFDFGLDEVSPSNVIDARGQFARKRYFHEFKWTPTRDIEATVMTAIFGKDGL